ncbi:hypothetical protein HanPI659440_Chr11g0434371 [Helianthus annuus]|nr:hypothetical protein HanPI659440_Chr11g0434371 [Helianthus annuus]
MEIVVDPGVQAFSEWYDYALVGCVIDFSTLTKLRRILKLISPYKIDVKYVGGFHVILLFGNNFEKQRFFESKKEWAEVFCQLQDWKGQDCQVERIIWLKLHGVPIMLSNVQVFDAIAGRFGDVIQSAQFTENNTDLSFAVCGVLCKSVERIQQTVALRWKDKVFHVRVEEEAGDWIPDCLVELDEVGDEMVTNNVMDIGGSEGNTSDVIRDEQI